MLSKEPIFVGDSAPVLRGGKFFLTKGVVVFLDEWITGNESEGGL